MNMDPDALQQTEADLALALRAYIEARTDIAAIDDITDDAMAAVNESLKSNWDIES